MFAEVTGENLVRDLFANYKLNLSFDCDEKCLIYLFKSCGKQGNTIDHFRSRWNNYKSDVREAESGNMENFKQRFLQSDFLQRDHQGFLKDVEVRLIGQGFWSHQKEVLLDEKTENFVSWRR